MEYTDRHVISYEAGQLNPDEVERALRDLKLNPAFHTHGNVVLSIPQDKSDSVARLEERFGSRIKIEQVPLPKS